MGRLLTLRTRLVPKPTTFKLTETFPSSLMFFMEAEVFGVSKCSPGSLYRFSVLRTSNGFYKTLLSC